MIQNKLKNSSVSRPPIISVMGHVDHGKSTLLDYIRKSNTVAEEVGGITQRLSAYEVNYKLKDGSERKLTFLDTPGHEAFCAIRKRGAKIADSAILVVSGEDGVKPQTLEALGCLKETKTPFVVAINKTDKPTADINRTKQSLAENEIYLEGYGGDVSAVPISAKTGDGVSELIELAILSAELTGLKARLDSPASGIVIETDTDQKHGINATVIITDGSLHAGMCIVAGRSFSPARIMSDSHGLKIKTATVSAPIRIAGFDSVPEVGSKFQSFKTKKEALTFIENLPKENRPTSSHKKNDSTDEDPKILPIFLNADFDGSLEAITHEINKIKNNRLNIKIIQKEIGNINEDEVKRAGSKPGTLMLSFNVEIEPKAKLLADRLKVEIQNFKIIYKLTEWLQKAVSDRSPKIATEELAGRAKIARLFSSEKDRYIVGGKMEMGKLILGAEVRIKRREIEIGRGKIKNLQQNKINIQEVTVEKEFGAQIQSPIPIAPGDYLELITTEMR